VLPTGRPSGASAPTLETGQTQQGRPPRRTPLELQRLWRTSWWCGPVRSASPRGPPAPPPAGP
jgi:hypothetical protein